MAACNFTIAFAKPADEILAKAKKTIESQNGSFNGNETEGHFDVTIFGNTIKGTYTVQGQSLNIDIVEKPFLIPCNMIETYLTGQLN